MKGALERCSDTAQATTTPPPTVIVFNNDPNVPNTGSNSTKAGKVQNYRLCLVLRLITINTESYY
jgi:hypothetical protein